MRVLILVPLLHSELDLGSLSEQVKLAYVQAHGLLKWQHHHAAIQRLWTAIELLLQQLIEALPLSAAKIRLYQDGLPLCGFEGQIVKELAAKGSPNHRLLLELMTKGAQLMGTESPDLLVQEYESQKAHLICAKTSGKLQADSALAEQDTLLIQRDKYVAEQINATLGINELGILFMGSAHSVHSWLSPDIRLKTLMPSVGNVITPDSVELIPRKT